MRTVSHGASQYSCHRLQSLYDAIHKEGAAPASTDKRLAIELGHSQGQGSVRCNGLEVDGCKISNRRLLDETRLKKVRGSLTKIPAELLQKRICWTNANKSERFVTVLPMTKNYGLRANDRMAKMGCRQEKFEECESGCAYHSITVFVTNTLMKVPTRCCTCEKCSQLLCTTDVDLDLEIRTSANVMESAAWIEFTRPWFVLQTYCERWKCVNRRLLCCRAMV